MGKNEFGRRIAESRRAKRLSVRELAKMIGMDFTRLSKIEHGDRPPPEPEYIARLAKALDLDAFELARLAKISNEFFEALATSPQARAYFARIDRQSQQERRESALKKSK